MTELGDDYRYFRFYLSGRGDGNHRRAKGRRAGRYYNYARYDADMAGVTRLPERSGDIIIKPLILK